VKLARLTSLLACGVLSVVALGAAPTSAPTGPTAPTAPTAPASDPSKTYDLRFRPTVGLRWTYQIIADTDARNLGTPDSDATDTPGRTRVSMVVNSEEVTEVRNGKAVARRVTFGPECWTASTDGVKKAKKTPLFCAGTTFNIRIAPDGSLQTDSMQKPRPDENRRLRNAMNATGALFPPRPVAIGEQWRADEALRAIANLAGDDDIKAALMLKGVREEKGRQVADIALISRAVASVGQGAKATINYKGALVIDVATGLTLKADITGRFQASATKDEKGKKTTTTTSGAGKVAVHTLAYILADPTSPNRFARSPGEMPNAADALADPTDIDGTDN
jgi:hypothetical protein